DVSHRRQNVGENLKVRAKLLAAAEEERMALLARHEPGVGIEFAEIGRADNEIGFRERRAVLSRGNRKTDIGRPDARDVAWVRLKTIEVGAAKRSKIGTRGKRPFEHVDLAAPSILIAACHITAPPRKACKV